MTRLAVAILLILKVGLAFQTPNGTSTAKRPARLQLGTPQRVETLAKAKRRFRLDSSKPQVVRLRLTELGADVRTSVQTSAGEELCAADSWADGWQIDELACSLHKADSYIVSIDVWKTSAAAPAYILEWTDARELTGQGGINDVQIQNAIAAAHKLAKADKPDLTAARAALDKAWTLAEVMMANRRKAEILMAKGILAGMVPELETARKFLDEAVTTYTAAGDLAGEARARNQAGWAYYQLGRSDADAAHQEKALELWRRVGDARGEAMTSTHLGRQQHFKRNRAEALAFYTKALEHYRKQGDVDGQSDVLDYLGHLHQSFGDKQAALETFRESLRLVAGRGDLTEAYTRNNLGTLYYSLGEYTLALGELDKAASLASRNADGVLAARARMGMASILSDLDRPSEALQALEKARGMMEAAQDRRGLGIAWNNSARALRELGRLEEAQAATARAHEIFLKIKFAQGIRQTRSSLGRLSIELGDLPGARKHLDEALSESREAADNDQVAVLLGSLAKLESAAGNLEAASANADAAVRLVESERNRLARDDLRSSYFSLVRPLYERKADILMRRHEADPGGKWNVAAFEVSEAARARAVAEVIPGARERFTGIPPQLLAKESELRDRVRAALRSSDKGVDDLLEDLRAVQAEIRSRSPRYGASSEAIVAKLDEAARLLDDDTVALEFMLCEDRSYLWAVHRGKVESFVLPASTVIASAARAVREAAALPNTRPGVSRDQSAFWRAAAHLSTMIFAPARHMLSAKRLVIVADGPLHTIPFAALPAPNASGPQLRQPMIVDHEIVMLPSLSVLHLARSKQQQRARTGMSLAIIGDPVYQRNDERLDGMRARISDASRGSLNPKFDRLDYSADEVAAIAAAANGRADVLTGFDAMMSRVSGSALADYDVLHFATHAVVSEHRPDVSGLALSMVDRRGRPVDGFLRLMDIYALEVSAKLVVLSACETAMGKNVGGEGVIGLTRGFLFAGAQSVVSTLWQVRDAATADLMGRFYREMLSRERSSSAALRQAQLAMWKQRRWNSPYYWAAFVHSGEWK